jgi:hypothetical protein
VEPLFKKYIAVSPYSYSLSNPLNLVDVNGNDVYSDKDKPEQEKYIRDVYNLYAGGDVLDPQLIETANRTFPKKSDYSVSNIGPINEDEWSAFTGYKTIYDQEDPSKILFSGLGITLNPSYFDEKNKYVSALLLEHELAHLKSYELTIKQKFEGDINKFDEWADTKEGKIQLAEHELRMIAYTLNRLDVYKDKGYITGNDYERVKEKLNEYKTKTGAQIKEYEK